MTSRCSRRSQVLIAVAVAIGSLGLGTTSVQPANAAPRQKADVQTKRASAAPTRPLIFTYYFYWYNTATGLHLGPNDPLPNHPAPQPATSYRSVEWHRRQLADMSRALIDVVLPVYWGENADSWELWSSPGLDALVEARRQMVAEGLSPPKIGMFYDTSIIAGLDLRSGENQSIFYSHMRSFFRHIPPADRALIDRKPVIWLFAPQGNTYDQSTFDFASSRFRKDFGVAPYIARDVAWTNVSTAASFPWGAAQNGLLYTDQVATVGPGYDERQIDGRSGVYRDRDNGNWYQYNLWNALNFGRPLIAIETWNEFHEASGIGETLEYGRDYIEMTRNLVSLSRGGSVS